MNIKAVDQTRSSGFTLIELLVVIAILGILISLSVFGMQGAKLASRDGKRQADLELMRSGLEMYKADCNVYPATLSWGGTLTGSCPTSNTYISLIPSDPVTSQNYDYHVCTDGSKYILCARLENTSPGIGAGITCADATPLTNCGSGSDCGAGNCNYRVTSP